MATPRKTNVTFVVSWGYNYYQCISTKVINLEISDGSIQASRKVGEIGVRVSISFSRLGTVGSFRPNILFI